MYRVKEINGKFIPQVGNWFVGYKSIDRYTSYTWSCPENAIYCEFDTLKEALDRIEKHRPKHHKAKYRKVK